MHTLSSYSSSTVYSLPKYPRYYCHLRRYFEYFRRSKAHSTYIPSWLEYTSHFRTPNPLLSKSFLARLLTFLNRPRYDHALYPRISSQALSFRAGFSFYNQPTPTINGCADMTDICIFVPSPTFLSAVESFRNELNYCTCKCSVLYRPLFFHLCGCEIQCRVKKFLLWKPILWSTAR
jgi:hypothetical protein